MKTKNEILANILIALGISLAECHAKPWHCVEDVIHFSKENEGIVGAMHDVKTLLIN